MKFDNERGDSMQQFFMGTVIIVIAIIALGMLIYFLIPNKRYEATLQKDNVRTEYVEKEAEEVDHQDLVTVIDVKFKGYSGKFTYSTMHDNVNKDQYVLVLTQDGIRCAKVVSHPKRLKVSDLSFPPFLLQSIICVADESDLDYYK